MSSDSMEVRSRRSSWSSRSLNTGIPAFDGWAVEGSVGGGYVVGEDGFEGGREEAAVVRGLRLQVSGVGCVEACQPGRGFRVQPECVLRTDEMLYLCEGPVTLSGQQHVHDVRTENPLKEPAVVEPTFSGSVVSGRAKA